MSGEHLKSVDIEELAEARTIVHLGQPPVAHLVTLEELCVQFDKSRNGKSRRKVATGPYLKSQKRDWEVLGGGGGSAKRYKSVHARDTTAGHS